MRRQTISSTVRHRPKRVRFKNPAEKGLGVKNRDLYTDFETSMRMGRVGRSGTKPELLVRKSCAKLGLRYRVKNDGLPGSPDLANRARKWAIFVHGCFWHRHPGCPHATMPKRNASFWKAKFLRNSMRDRVVAHALRRKGYAVKTIWACETMSAAKLEAKLKSLKNRC